MTRKLFLSMAALRDDTITWKPRLQNRYEVTKQGWCGERKGIEKRIERLRARIKRRSLCTSCSVWGVAIALDEGRGKGHGLETRSEEWEGRRRRVNPLHE